MKRGMLILGLAIFTIGGFTIASMAHPTSAEQSSNPPDTSTNSLPQQGTPTPTQCVTSYTYAVTAGATIVPGTTDIGNHTDDGVTFITLPFPVTLYGATYTGVNLGANGNAQFVSTNEEFENVCLPFAEMGPTIFAYWEDLTTEGTNCTGGCGIYTSISGSAPNRIFNIEWRTFYFSEPGNAYFEIRLYEATSNFDIILGTLNTTATSTIGVQDGAGGFVQYRCNTAPPTNSRIAFSAISGTCSSPTPTTTPGGATSTPTRTNTVGVATSTTTRTNTTVPQATGTATSPVPSATRTATSVIPTGTGTSVVASATAISTSQATATSQGGTATATSEATATPCTISFTDVPPDSTFYTWIRCLSCRNIISGYTDGTFKPGNDITRGQIAKMVSNSAGFSEDPGPQIYEDVPEASPFYAWINRLSMRGHMGGYPCGLVPEEPCEPPDNRPYFRPNASATRGQLAKIVSNAAGLGGTPTGLFYTDVTEDHTFYLWIMRLTQLGVMSGYLCGGEGEPCDEESRPYFRPFNNVTRGQASKIVANTFFPNCETPARH
ncbi:MAG TPA: S-layer homology domain-containing protein [Chloroflexia bacterium]|nr:S-layer homology domain-containing protein [Chloroflexia bacterium]